MLSSGVGAFVHFWGSYNPILMKRCMPMVVWPRAREVSKSVLGCGATGRIYGVGGLGFRAHWLDKCKLGMKEGASLVLLLQVPIAGCDDFGIFWGVYRTTFWKTPAHTHISLVMTAAEVGLPFAFWGSIVYTLELGILRILQGGGEVAVREGLAFVGLASSFCVFFFFFFFFFWAVCRPFRGQVCLGLRSLQEAPAKSRKNDQQCRPKCEMKIEGRLWGLLGSVFGFLHRCSL